MSGRKLIVLLVVALLAGSLVAAPAIAQEGGEGGEGGEAGEGDEVGEGGEAGEEGEEEGGIEAAIEGFIESQSLLGVVLVLAFGVILLTACVEKLISYLTRMAIKTRISLFALAIIFTGFEFDDTILGIVLAAGDLEGAALGTALGTALAIIGVTLALAAVIQPFQVDLPTDYIAVFALAPLLLLPFVLFGTLTFVLGLVLLAFFVLGFAYFVVRERQRDTPVFRSTELGKAVRPDGGTEVRPDGDAVFPEPLADIPEDRLVGNRTGWIWFGLSVLALIGIVVAAMLLEGGSGVVIERFGLSGTVFGATVLTAILTFEDIMLTIEPVRRGVPEIGVGNVIGSLLFSMTGNIGVLALVSTITIAPSVLTLHLPAIIVMVFLAAYFMYQGEVKRWYGYLLLGLYVAYWVIALTLFSGVPVGE
jgi:cation:H+ antiporter